MKKKKIDGSAIRLLSLKEDKFKQTIVYRSFLILRQTLAPAFPAGDAQALADG
ncbi:MAG TPA: hypothetical protein PLB05_06110 [Candidatus Omnitrophota bacterium]|nr:hypothetical protein [Candidatus Omnitrophota bacterium]HPN55471.1 hypothetical protein [Candidatus Omnitrophota bacterium]